jgi:hypothetical protein
VGFEKAGVLTTSFFMCPYIIANRRNPNTPKLQSIIIQPKGMFLNEPAMKAKGITSTQAIKPNSITQIFLTGFLYGPIKRIAKTKWAKASQS